MKKVNPKRIVLGAGIGAALLGIFAVAVFFVPVFRVSAYSVTGQSHTDSAEIEGATNIKIGDNLVRINAPAAAQSVAGLPWISKATVRREFPSTVVVEVEEHRAVLWVKRDDGVHLIDEQGHPFVIDTAPAGTIELTGTKDDDTATFSDVIATLDALDPETRGAVTRMKAPTRYEISFFTQDNREVYWGASENNHNKAVAMKTVLGMDGDYWNVSAPALVTKR